VSKLVADLEEFKEKTKRMVGKKPKRALITPGKI